MRKSFQGVSHAKKHGVDTSSERNRLIGMSVLLVLVGALWIGSKWKENEYREKEDAEIAIEEKKEPVVAIAVPTVDVEGIKALVADRDELDRVTLERDALELALNNLGPYLDSHFEAMDGRLLDAQADLEIRADPDLARGEMFRVRGVIEDFEIEDRALFDLVRGRMRTEDGKVVYFATERVPVGIDHGDWVRLDGLFVKLFRDENEQREWVEGPLIVGPRLAESFEALGPVTEIDPTRFATITDADLDDGGDLRDYYLERFELLAHARDLPADAIDWSTVPELTNEKLTEVFEDGERWRCQPFRIPISQLQDGRTVAVGENPARLDRVGQGWIGNFQWLGPAPVIRFQTPFPLEGLAFKDLVTANGFFLMNFKYEAQKGDIRVAPFFVLSSIERYIPAQNNFTTIALWTVVGIVLMLAALFWLLLMRDKRKASALREELVRRRRERRGRAATAPTAP